MGNLHGALCGVEFVLSGCLVVNGAEHHVSGELDKGKVEGFAQPGVTICFFCFHGFLLKHVSTRVAVNFREYQPVQKWVYYHYYYCNYKRAVCIRTLCVKDPGRYVSH